MKLLIVWLSLISALFAFTEDTNHTLQSNQTSNTDILTQEELKKLPKVLYLSYENIPSRVLKGEIFTVTIKSLPTTKKFTDITYELSGSKGLKLLSDYPSREIDSKYYYETFYFLATSSSVRLPDIKATLVSYDDTPFRSTTISGKKLNVLSLNPKKNFANIIADKFELLEYKTTNYDQKHNIVVFVATAKNSDIASFKLQNVHKQGIESVLESYFDSKITYYAVIDKKIKNLSFSYFNIKKNRYELIHIPIIVNDDSVTTQSDLKPKDQSREVIKMQIAAAVAVILFIMIMWRKKYIYLFFLLIPITYIAFLSVPSESICIKRSANIQLLPVTNGTIFETTPRVYHLQKEGETKGFTKVKLHNDKIGWVKNEDICSY